MSYENLMRPYEIQQAVKTLEYEEKEAMLNVY